MAVNGKATKQAGPAKRAGMDRSKYEAVLQAIEELGEDYTYEQYRDFMIKRGMILSRPDV